MMAKITYSFEDAIQIYHRSSSTIEDELLDFDQFTKEQYAEKIGSVDGKPDEAFPVLVAVRKAREAE